MPSRPWTRGTTLVEAMAGTALLGTLLVTLLIAASRLGLQTARAERRIEACRIADRLLEGWWTMKRDEFPRNASGAVPGVQGWRWRTTEVSNGDAITLGGHVVAVDIFAPMEETGTPEPAVRVELVLPEKSDASQTGPNAG